MNCSVTEIDDFDPPYVTRPDVPFERVRIKIGTGYGAVYEEGVRTYAHVQYGMCYKLAR